MICFVLMGMTLSFLSEAQRMLEPVGHVVCTFCFKGKASGECRRSTNKKKAQNPTCRLRPLRGYGTIREGPAPITQATFIVSSHLNFAGSQVRFQKQLQYLRSCKYNFKADKQPVLMAVLQIRLPIESLIILLSVYLILSVSKIIKFLQKKSN